MVKKRVLITGANGQDGSYLIEHCLDRNWEVHGILKRNSVAETQDLRIQHLENKISTYYGDMIDFSSLIRILKTVKPHCIFNLAAQSHVRISTDMPIYTGLTNAIGVLNLLEATKVTVPTARIYQASSSEIFGNSIDRDGFQRLTTPMRPTSPYGIAKLYAFNMIHHYRIGHKMFCSNGVLFNHESPRRGSNFVTAKVVKRAVEIYLGLKAELRLGNIETRRDWGHSKDYTRAMIKILEHKEPDDFIIATGENHSIKEMCNIVFSMLDMNYKDYVIQDEKYMRPEDLKELCGDSTRSREILNWDPTYTFESMLQEMVDFWLNKLKK